MTTDVSTSSAPPAPPAIRGWLRTPAKGRFHRINAYCTSIVTISRRWNVDIWEYESLDTYMTNSAHSCIFSSIGVSDADLEKLKNYILTFAPEHSE